MFRSWTERLLGGVCGGLSQVTPFNAWIWRALWVVLTLATAGVGALVYVVWWWLLPLETPLEGRKTHFIRTLVALALALVMLLGYTVRGTLVTGDGKDVYLPFLWLVVGLVFAYRQWTTRRTRGNIIWGLVAVVLPILALLSVGGVLPIGATDWLNRSVGAVAVFMGLSIFLRDRVRFGTVLSVVLTLILVVGMAVFAYSLRVNTQRTENEQTNTFVVSDAVTTLQVNLSTLDTETVVFSSSPNTRDIRFVYNGSPATDLQQDYSEDGAIATFTLIEKRPSGLPSLDSVGRGKLTVELPQGLAIAVAFSGERGNANFDLKQLNLERLNLQLTRGDALVTLPLYQPLSPSVAQNPGQLNVDSGSLVIVVDPQLGGQFLLNKATNRRPIFDDILYALEDNLNDWLLTARQYNNATAKVLYVVNVPNGTISLDTEIGE